jgi:KDO2-lipid IV(A) lauroyltransferase
VNWWLGCFLAWLWFDVLRLRRYTVLRNLTIAFPQMSPEDKYKIARKSMRYLCYGFPEILTLPMLTKKDIGKKVFFHGFENYEQALSKKKGVLILSLHLGNGDIGISYFAMKGNNSHLISKKFSNKIINDIWFAIRGAQGVRFIDPHGPKIAFEILAACRKNEGVVFVIDQFMGRPFGIESTFFGKKTGTAYGLALFASRTGAPVVPMYTYRDEKLNTHVVCEPEIPLENIEDRDLQTRVMTQKYNDKVQELVGRHPEQWMWVHRRWKRWR